MQAISNRKFRVALAGASILFFVNSAVAQTPEKFFAGKTVTLVIGFAVGGAYDTIARLVGRNLGEHIPGQPSVVAQNQPGAGSRNAANYMFTRAPRDGTVLGNFHANLAQVQALGMKSIAYDARKFNYVGRFSPNTAVLYTWHGSAIKNFRDLRTKPVVIAGTAPTSDSVIFSRMSNDLLGTKAKAVVGYKGTAAANLAMERGEADGVINYWEGFRSVLADWIGNKKINLIVQYRTDRHPDLQQVPAIYEAAETEGQRELMQFLLRAGEVGQYVALPPDVPNDRIEAMRKAFDEMVRDPKFLAAAAKQNLNVDPLSGAELQRKVASILSASPAVVEVVRGYYPPELLKPR